MCLDDVDEFSQQKLDFEFNYNLSLTLWYGLYGAKIERIENVMDVPFKLEKLVVALNVFFIIDLLVSHKKLSPSVLQALDLELKPLTNNFKMGFLVIIILYMLSL